MSTTWSATQPNAHAYCGGEIQRLDAEVRRLQERVPCAGCNYGDGPQEDCPQHGREYGWWVEGANTLRARLDAALALHQPLDALNVRSGRQERVCTGCGTDDGNWSRWPCMTARACGVTR